MLLVTSSTKIMELSKGVLFLFSENRKSLAHNQIKNQRSIHNCSARMSAAKIVMFSSTIFLGVCTFILVVDAMLIDALRANSHGFPSPTHFNKS